MDRRELMNDEQEALRMAMDGRISSLWTATPGIITAIDLTKRTCSVQPSIKGRVQNSDGSYEFVNLPLLVDVPIVFPSAGGFTLSLPIAVNNEVLVVFASRCIDAWWSNGGVGIPMEQRMHDLSDGFAIPGPRSIPNATALHASNARLMKDDGTAYVEVTPGGAVNMKATTTVSIDAPTITLTGNVIVPVGKTLTVQGLDFSTHKHLGVTTGAGTSGVPTP
jgi:hypothetical protein